MSLCELTVMTLYNYVIRAHNKLHKVTIIMCMTVAKVILVDNSRAEYVRIQCYPLVFFVNHISGYDIVTDTTLLS